MNLVHRAALLTLAVFLPAGSACGQGPHVPVEPSVPAEVKYKTGYVNPVSPPAGFSSAMLWGIAIADTRVPGYESAKVAVASTRLVCQVQGKEVVLNDDTAKLRGGLYRRFPWFGTDEHLPLTFGYDASDDAVILPVGQDATHVWHFWSASPRATLPPGKLNGCTVSVRAKISAGALLQVGFDYWRNSSIAYGAGGNNHEAGASNWYFPSSDWQEATFTDLPRPQR